MVLFGGWSIDQVSPSSRGFTSKNYKVITQYMDSLKKYWLDHRITQRITNLEKLVGELDWDELWQCYNAIDCDITRGMLAAERKVKKSGKHKHEWSIALAQAGY